VGLTDDYENLIAATLFHVETVERAFGLGRFR
jgi:hypothetical protein